MKFPLHILHLEDDPNDAALVQSTLEAEGIACTTICVQNRDDFVAALERGNVDLILSDFSLPTFDGFSAAEIVCAKWPAIPLILVSGTLGEEQAIDSLKNGATDYVLKDRLSRLAPAVRRAMEEVEERDERKRAEEALRTSEERYRALFESNPSPMWIYDLETLSFLAVNAAALKHYGYSQVEFLAMTIKDIRPSEDIPILMQNVEQTPAALVCSRYWQHRKKNGDLIDVEITSHELLWLGRRARVVLVHDVTERKRAEGTAQLLQKVEEEHRLAVESARVKNEFLATMSHELRTPLNAVIGFTGTLLMEIPGPITAAQKKQLQTIKSSARHQLSLINDLLDLAKIESGKINLKLEPIVCEEVVQSVAETLKGMAENKGLAFQVDLPLETTIAHAEKRALKQILINLVNNAIKFTEQGEVSIRLHRENGHVEIAVGDTGGGIKAEDRAKLFQAFARLENANGRHQEGTGLGLHLSQKLAELLGGEIRLESEPGKGSTFTVVLAAESCVKEAA